MVSNHKKHHLNKNNSCNLRAIPDKNILESRFPLHFISKIELGQWSFYNFCVSILFVAKLLYSKDFLFFSSLEVFSFCENCYHYYTTSLNEAWTKALRRFKSYLRCAGDSRWWGSLTMVLAVNKSKCLSPVNHTTKTIHHHHLILSGFSFPQLLHRLLSNF